MKLTYRQILEKDFTIELKENKLNKIKVDKVKYEKNLNVLKYLDNNIKIANDSGFTFISNMTYADILKEYFLSQEFEHSINKLRHEKENEDYIKEYIIKAKTYVKFFMKHKEINNDDSSIVSDEEISAVSSTGFCISVSKGDNSPIAIKSPDGQDGYSCKSIRLYINNTTGYAIAETEDGNISFAVSDPAGIYRRLEEMAG